MGIGVCPRCQQRYIYDSHEIDYQHNCGEQNAASEVLKNEDVVVMGSWEDYTGSATNPQQQVNVQGSDNKIWGQRGWIEGEKVSDKTSRGNDIDKFRSRRFINHIELK